MHVAAYDPLRDPIWQFIGVLLSAALSIAALVLPYLLSKDSDSTTKMKAIAAFGAFRQPDSSLGCMGSLGLFVFLLTASYFLFQLLLRLFFLDRTLDQNTLLVMSFAVVFSITIFFTIFRHGQLLRILVFHFLLISFIFSLVVVSLKFGTFGYNNFTFIQQFVQHYIPAIKNIPLHLKAIPVDVIIKDQAAAQTIFIWMYGISLFFFLFSYGYSKRRESLRAEAFQFMSAEEREIKLQELDKWSKELDIEKKELDLKKMRITYAQDLSAAFVETAQPGVDAMTRAALTRAFFPRFLQLGNMKTEEIDLPGIGKIGKIEPFYIVPNLLNWDFFTASALTRETGMHIVIQGEVTRIGVESGIVVYQNPAPGSPHKKDSEISVILSKQEFFETRLLSETVEGTYSEFLPVDELPSPVVQEAQLLPEAIEGTNSKIVQVDAAASPGAQKAQLLPELVKETESKDVPVDELPPPGAQEPQKEKVGKKGKKQGKKDKNRAEVAGDEESSQKPEKEKAGKKQKKGGGKDKTGGDVSHSARGDEISQEPGKEKAGKKGKKYGGKDKTRSIDEVAQQISSGQNELSLNDQEPVEASPSLPASPPPGTIHTDPLEDVGQSALVSQSEEEIVGLNPTDELAPEAIHTDPLEDVEQLAPVSQPEERFVDVGPGDELAPEAIQTDLLEDVGQLAPTSQAVPQSEPKEQIIYLDPDDDLTEVLERLENRAARHIIMVVPSQTQLRSHVVWRMLHTRLRAMGKEIDVISSDRQIRAIAKYAGFSVEDPYQSGKSQSASRSSRSIRERREAHRFSRLYGNPGPASNFNPWPDPLPFEESEEPLSVPLPEQYNETIIEDVDETMPYIPN